MTVETWEDAFAANAKQAETVYGIAFTARSGSTWLGQRLIASKVLGDPREFFNIKAAEHSVHYSGARDFAEYFRYLRTVRQTGGVFGYEVAYPHFKKLVVEGHVEFIDATTHWFFLRRRDMVGQAISHFRAANSGLYHAIPGRSAEKAPAPDYNADEIAGLLLRTAAFEYEFAQFFRDSGIQPTELWYEDCAVLSHEQLIELFVSTLGLDRGRIAAALELEEESALKKLADQDSHRLADRFREDRPELVAFWEENRGHESVTSFTEKESRYTSLLPHWLRRPAGNLQKLAQLARGGGDS